MTGVQTCALPILRFSKDDLPAGSKVSVAVEFCAWYEFRAEDILELSLEYEKMSGISFVTDGRLVLSRAAACASAEDGKRWREMSDPWLDEGEDESFWGNVMKGWCDVELLLSRTKEGERFFDCGTLLTEDAGEGGVGGFSAELNEAGDLVLLFGKSSREEEHEPNAYGRYIEGFDARFPDFSGEMRLAVESVSNEWYATGMSSGKDGVAITGRILNKRYRGARVSFAFGGVTELVFEIPKKWGKETELVVCPDRDGTYYVRLGTEVHFSCKRIAFAE